MDANTHEVIRMLTDALERVQRRGAIGFELHIAHADGLSEYRHWNVRDMDAVEAEFAAMPVQGGEQ